MNESERTIHRYLDSCHLGELKYEPDGNVPPDFSIDERIAVEARRLNEHEEVESGHRGLEITSKPLHAAVIKALARSGPPVESRSWFVHYTVRRPLPPWREVERALSEAVAEFHDRVASPPDEIQLGRFMRLRFLRAGQAHQTLLLLGGSADHDAGGFVVAELARNLDICIPEKLRKIEPFRQRYAEWWLALDDRISYGALDPDDITQLRQALGPIVGFDKVILVSPLEPTNAIELWSSVSSPA